MRLQKFLSMAKVCSRRAGEQLIREGRVKVNGSVVSEPGVKVDPEKDRVEVDERPVKLSGERRYLLLYKPAGFLTTLKDPARRPTVKDLVGSAAGRVFPVGRLDMYTSGLLLLTDDGELAHRLMHPSYGAEKEYLVRVRGEVAPETLRRLARGVDLEDGRTAPATVKLVRGDQESSLLSLVIKEGRNRQVRRMMEAVGHKVISLKRVRFGPLVLAGLKPGEWRFLTAGEVRELKKLVAHPAGRRKEERR